MGAAFVREPSALPELVDRDEPAAEFAAHHARLVAYVVAGEITVDVERVPLERLPNAWRRKTDGAAGKLVVVPSQSRYSGGISTSSANSSSGPTGY